ncbi:MAG: hypothetical protein JNL01_16065 [Bdellovibrionales bacterium]|nr:hypothetical protein [Bdellovibrionales bacterium]
MTIWTLVLNCFHSALIDEMNAKLPQEKPVLGLPRRSKGFSYPESQDPKGVQAVYIPIFADPMGPTSPQTKGGGIVLAVEASFCELMGVTGIDSFYRVLFQRVGSEFAKRNIKPRIGQIENLSGQLPAGTPPPEKVIWIPFELKQSRSWIAIAV